MPERKLSPLVTWEATGNGAQAMLKPEIQVSFNKRLLKDVHDAQSLEHFGIKVNIPANKRINSVKLERLVYMPLVDTVLAEFDGSNYPDPQTMKEEEVEFTVYQKGAWGVVNTEVTRKEIKEFRNRRSLRFSTQAKMTKEKDTGLSLCGASNIIFADDAADKAQVAGQRKRIVEGDFDKIGLEFHNQLAGKFTSTQGSTAANKSESIEAAWVALCHPAVVNDITKLPGFMHARDYAGTKLANEVGQIGEFKIIRSPYMKVEDVAGTKVYTSAVFGLEAFATTSFGSYGSVEMIYHGEGSAGTGDPLNLIGGTIGWKAYAGTVICNDAWIANILSTATLAVGNKHYIDGGKL